MNPTELPSWNHCPSIKRIATLITSAHKMARTHIRVSRIHGSWTVWMHIVQLNDILPSMNWHNFFIRLFMYIIMMISRYMYACVLFQSYLNISLGETGSFLCSPCACRQLHRCCYSCFSYSRWWGDFLLILFCLVPLHTLRRCYIFNDVSVVGARVRLLH